jgi:hypothetical protein
MADDDSKRDKPGIMTLAWFEPLYRRVILIAVITAWSIWEWLFNNDQFWGMMTLAMLAYGVWTFFINFDKALGEQRKKDAKPKS